MARAPAGGIVVTVAIELRAAERCLGISGAPLLMQGPPLVQECLPTQDLAVVLLDVDVRHDVCSVSQQSSDHAGGVGESFVEGGAAVACLVLVVQDEHVHG